MLSDWYRQELKIATEKAKIYDKAAANYKRLNIEFKDNTEKIAKLKSDLIKASKSGDPTDKIIDEIKTLELQLEANRSAALSTQGDQANYSKYKNICAADEKLKERRAAFKDFIPLIEERYLSACEQEAERSARGWSTGNHNPLGKSAFGTDPIGQLVYALIFTKIK